MSQDLPIPDFFFLLGNITFLKYNFGKDASGVENSRRTRTSKGKKNDTASLRRNGFDKLEALGRLDRQDQEGRNSLPIKKKGTLKI